MLCNDIDDDIDILAAQASDNREQGCELFKRRETEGSYTLLVRNHLIDSEVKFKEYFRLSRDQFSYLAEFVKKDCAVEPSNRVRNPISPEMKLAVTLR